LIRAELVIGLPDYEISDLEIREGKSGSSPGTPVRERARTAEAGSCAIKADTSVEYGMRTGVYGIAYFIWRQGSGSAGSADGISGNGFPVSNRAKGPQKPFRE